MKFVKQRVWRFLEAVARSIGCEIRRLSPPSEFSKIPDAKLYRPMFSPWSSREGEFASDYRLAIPRTLVSAERCYILHTLAKQSLNVPGDFWECGVYKGGTAAMFAAFLKRSAPDRRLHLFDTFEGMPETDAERDLHRKGDFADTGFDSVKAYVRHDDVCVYHQGFIPDTFAGLESATVAFAHIDVDIYKSILDSLEFIWPRLSAGGSIVFDDYGFPSCPGARSAVDKFFADLPAEPLCLSTGQAVVFKSRS